MTDINEQLLILISEGKTNDEICNILNISKKQLKRRIESLKYDGHSIKRKFNYDATQGYYIYQGKSYMNSSSISIDQIQSNDFKAMLISDTHIGHTDGNMDYIKRIYDYCSKNNIHIIMHLGDLFEGSNNPSMNLEQQLDYYFHNYPSDSTFLTFVSQGNHDMDFQTKLGLNLKNIIEKERDDMVILEDSSSTIEILDNRLLISHKNKYPLGTSGFKIGGHKHFYNFSYDNTNPTLNVPTLSDLLIKDNYPGAIELTLKSNGKKIYSILLNHLIIDNNDIKKASTVECPFPRTNCKKRRKM